MVARNEVEIVTCVTGMSAVDVSTSKTFAQGMKKTLVKMLGHMKLSLKTLRIAETPPWIAMAGIEHLSIGPEMEHETSLIFLEENIKELTHGIIKMLRGDSVTR